MEKVITEVEAQQYKLAVIEYLGDTGLSYLRDANVNGNLLLAWGSFAYGRVGMYVRNHLRKKFPELDEKFPNYDDFEDFSFELIKNILTDI